MGLSAGPFVNGKEVVRTLPASPVVITNRNLAPERNENIALSEIDFKMKFFILGCPLPGRF